MRLSKQNILGFTLMLGCVTALTPLAIDMYLPSFGAISRHFDASQSDVELSLTVFFIGLAIGQLIYGPLADRFGRRRPLIVGLMIASLTSFGCAMVPNIHDFILLRFLQAFGVCAGAVISRAIVRDMFEPVEVARFFSLLMLVMGVAPILAPIMGAQLALHFGWPAIFEFIAGFGFLCLVAVVILLPETRGPNPGVRLTAALSTYRDILRDKRFTGFSLAGGAAMAGMFAYITGSSFVLIDHFGVAPENFGFVFGANAAGFIFVTQINRALLKRHSYEKILGNAVKLHLLAAVALVVAAASNAPLALFLAPLFVFIASLGMIAPNAMAGALSGEGARAGAASALAGSLQFSLSFFSSGLIGIMHAASPLPLCLVMVSCATISVFFVQRARS